jgi:hypothetical protein
VIFTPQEDLKQNCMFGTVQMSCTHNCMCASPPYIYIYIYIDISYIKCNVVTLSVCHLAEGNVGLHENKHKKRLAFLLSVEALLADRF